MDANTRKALAAFAASQYGQFNVWQAKELGVTRDHLHRAMQSGELVRVRPSAYRFAGTPVTWRTELHADTLSAPKGAYAAQSAALRLHRVSFDALPYRREIVKVGSGLIHPADEVVVHRTRRLDPQDVRTIDDITSTSLGRSLVDVAPFLEWWQLIDLADKALCEWPSAQATVHRTAKRLRRGRRGVDRLVQVTGPGAEKAFRSWLERTASPLTARAGIHDAKWNVNVPGVPGAGLVDTYSASRLLVVEWKGLAFHRKPNQLQRDSDKQNAAVSHGLAALSFTWLDVVTRPDHVVTVLRTAAHRHRRAA